MEEQFVPYELALKLKELGFDERCLAGYYNDGKSLWFFRFHKNSEREPTVAKRFATAPLWEQALNWFRGKYKFKVGIGINDKGLYYDYKIVLFNTTDAYYKDCYNTYEEARLACLEKLIELVELKKDSV